MLGDPNIRSIFDGITLQGFRQLVGSINRTRRRSREAGASLPPILRRIPATSAIGSDAGSRLYKPSAGSSSTMRTPRSR